MGVIVSLVIRTDEALSQALESRAKQAGVEPAEYALAILREAMNRDEADLERAIQETLQENAELYRRLA